MYQLKWLYGIQENSYTKAFIHRHKFRVHVIERKLLERQIIRVKCLIIVYSLSIFSAIITNVIYTNGVFMLTVISSIKPLL